MRIYKRKSGIGIWGSKKNVTLETESRKQHLKKKKKI